MKKIIVVSTIFLLAACGKKSNPAATVTCATDASPYMAIYPDAQVRKSDVSVCSDGTYKATALDQSGATFKTAQLIVELRDSAGNVTQAVYSAQ